jgi:hypothetical protein
MAPKSQAALVAEALAGGWAEDRLFAALDAQAEKRIS